MRVRELSGAMLLWVAACQSDGARGPSAPVVVPELHGGPLGTPSQRASTGRALSAAAGMVASRLAAAERARRSPSRAEREYARFAEQEARKEIAALRTLGVEAPRAPERVGAYFAAEKEQVTALTQVAGDGARAAPDVASGNVLRMIADDAGRAARFIAAREALGTSPPPP